MGEIFGYADGNHIVPTWLRGRRRHPAPGSFCWMSGMLAAESWIRRTTRARAAAVA